MTNSFFLVFYEPRSTREKRKRDKSIERREEKNKKENKSLTDDLNSTFN